MKQSYLNRELRLEDADVAALNPSADRTRMKPNLLIAVGAEETAQFIDQSERYSAELSRAGIENALRVLPGINHYTMSRLLSGGANVVMDWILKPEAGNISPLR
ncbi:hypothetical protein [Hoeflea sp.]|uniref:hypothetical protein n=1 Tax=Hoeflea sp. TaxID=1940281 RepID=UPI003B025330